MLKTRTNSRKRVMTASLVSSVFIVLMISQPACVLITEGIYTRPVYRSYTCNATLMDTNNGERRTVASNMISATAPGAASRSFLTYDWDGNGTRNEADALLDWRRYLRNNVSTSTNFTGRSWCVVPSSTTCSDPRDVVWRSATPPTALPTPELPNCSAITGTQLEVSAPGLTSDNQFEFPDTAVGTGGPAIVFTVTNRSTVPLRVNGVSLMAGAFMPDFIKSADTCAPTAAEMTARRGHLLGAGAACTFQMQFVPQHRDGVPECSAGSPNESCRRTGSLSVTGEEDSTRSVVTPVIVRISGRATGGSIVTEPGEICFSSAPALGSCTPYQNLRIRNTSTGDLTLTSARLTRSGNLWEATMPFLMPLTLPMGLYVDVPVRFCNMANDPTDGEFTINSSSPTNPTTVVRLVNPLTRTCP